MWIQRSRSVKRRSNKDNSKNKLMCYRCGISNHGINECRSKAIICYNCKELTTNPNYTAKTCYKSRADSPNKVGFKFGRGQGIMRGGGMRTKTSKGRRTFRKNQNERGTNYRNLFKRIKINDGEKEKYAYIALTDLYKKEEAIGYFAEETDAEAMNVEGINQT